MNIKQHDEELNKIQVNNFHNDSIPLLIVYYRNVKRLLIQITVKYDYIFNSKNGHGKKIFYSFLFHKVHLKPITFINDIVIIH